MPPRRGAHGDHCPGRCLIATTNAQIAATVLDALSAVGGPFAVLHGEGDVAAGVCTSDVDIVAGEPARAIMTRAAGRLRARGLHTVMIWPYDVGSASVFVVDDAARDGAQFDVLSDRSGAGHYGVRADMVLAGAHAGVRWPRAAELDELLYLVKKRQRKRQHGRLAVLLAELGARSPDRTRRRVGELFAPSVAADVHDALDRRRRRSDPRGVVRATAANVPRAASRLARPVGYWVAVRGSGAPHVADDIMRRFDRVLPHAGAGPTSRRWSQLPKAAAEIAAVRWRAGIYASWGPPLKLLRPDLVVDTDPDADVAASRIVTAMEARLRL